MKNKLIDYLFYLKNCLLILKLEKECKKQNKAPFKPLGGVGNKNRLFWDEYTIFFVKEWLKTDKIKDSVDKTIEYYETKNNKKL